MNKIPSRQASYKNWGDFLKIEEKQNRFLERQKTEREALVAQLRKSAINSVRSDSIDGDNAFEGGNVSNSILADDCYADDCYADECLESYRYSQKASERQRRRRDRAPIVQELLNPDAMICVPQNLALEWYVYLRPEGNHVAVISQGQTTDIVSKSGKDSFRMPNKSLPHGLTILDAVLCDDQCNPLHSISETKRMTSVDNNVIVFIVDCICWNDMIMLDSPAECRHFFLKSRMEEADLEQPPTLEMGNNDKNIFRFVNWYDVSAPNLQLLYNTDFNYQKDGLVFVHKEAFYIPGINPLYLRFRDPICSKWCITTTDVERKNFPQNQTCYLKLNENQELQTEDGYPVSSLNDDELRDVPNVHQPLARVNIQNVKLDGNVGKFEVSIVTWMNKRNRKVADTMSRIIEQHLHRSGSQKIAFADILQAVS